MPQAGFASLGFFEKNQAQLGALLGKSSDWVSVRSRIHKLPDGLKERLRQGPRAIAQMLELGSFYALQPDVAMTLAERVVQENLTLDAIRGLVRGYVRPAARVESRAVAPERRGTATKVQEITNCPSDDHHESQNPREVTIGLRDALGNVEVPKSSRVQTDHRIIATGAPISPPDPRMPAVADELLLQQAAETLTVLASRADLLPVNAISRQVLDQMEAALIVLQRAFARRATMQNDRIGIT